MTSNYGHDALTYARDTIAPYLSATEEQIDLVALWSAHTHAYSAFATSPRLSVRSSQPGSGKTTVMNVAQALSRQGENASSATGASLYTLIHEEHPTLFLDEIDMMFSASGFSRANPQLQAILNDGYTSGGTVRVTRGGRSVKLSVFSPVCFAGIGSLPAAMASRAVPVMMTKGNPAEYFDPMIEGLFVADCRDVLADWLKCETRLETLALAERRPEIKGIDDPRIRQIAAPLLAIAMLASDEWYQRAVNAIRYAFLGVGSSKELTRFEMAARDALKVWPRETSFMTGRDLASRMAAMKDSPWKNLDTESMAGARQLAMLLKPSGVVSATHRIENEPTQSYARVDLEAAVKG